MASRSKARWKKAAQWFATRSSYALALASMLSTACGDYDTQPIVETVDLESSDLAVALLHADRDNLVVTGKAGSGNGSMFVAAFDADGAQRWRWLGAAGDQPASIAFDSARRQVVVAGTTLVEPDRFDLFVDRFSLSGEQQSRWTAPTDGDADSVGAVALDAAGDILVAGSFFDADNREACMATKLNSDTGAVVWQEFGDPYPTREQLCRWTWVGVTADNDYLLIGLEGSVDGLATRVRQTDSDGAFVNSTLWTVISGDHAVAISTLDATGGLVSAGTSARGAGRFSSLSRRNADGLFARAAWTDVRPDEEFRAVSSSSTSDIVACGNTALTGESDRALIRKLNREGDEIWSLTLEAPSRESERCTAISVDADGNAIAVLVSEPDGSGFTSRILRIRDPQ